MTMQDDLDARFAGVFDELDRTFGVAQPEPSVEQQPAEERPSLPVAGTPVGAITLESRTPLERSRARAAATAVARAIRPGAAPVLAVEEPAPAPTPVQRPGLTTAVVAGGAAEAESGVLVSWRGSGRVTRAQLERALHSALGGPAPDWLPRAHSPLMQAGRAIEGLNHHGLVVRRERTRPEGVREYTARWHVGMLQSQRLGSEFGRTVARFTLRDSVLEAEEDEGCPVVSEVEAVLVKYRAALSADEYQAADVTEWLGQLLRRRLLASRLGVCWYVPNITKECARAVLQEVAHYWGSDWMLGLPIATSEELRAGIHRSLQLEVEALINEVMEASATGKKLTESAALGYLKRLGALRDRFVGYAVLLGSIRVDSLRIKVLYAQNRIEEHVTDEGKRGALIWEELER